MVITDFLFGTQHEMDSIGEDRIAVSWKIDARFACRVFEKKTKCHSTMSIKIGFIGNS